MMLALKNLFNHTSFLEFNMEVKIQNFKWGIFNKYHKINTMM